VQVIRKKWTWLVHTPRSGHKVTKKIIKVTQNLVKKLHLEEAQAM